nr:twin-arginine translocase subunit TatB [Pseudomonas sp. BIGb0427]
MFEVGFTELLLVAIVALLVLGPERLAAARTLGRGLGQAKRAMATIKTQVERELDTQALSQELDALPLQRLEQDLRRGISLQPDHSPTSGNP